MPLSGLYCGMAPPQPLFFGAEGARMCHREAYEACCCPLNSVFRRMRVHECATEGSTRHTPAPSTVYVSPPACCRHGRVAETARHPDAAEGRHPAPAGLRHKQAGRAAVGLGEENEKSRPEETDWLGCHNAVIRTDCGYCSYCVLRNCGQSSRRGNLPGRTSLPEGRRRGRGKTAAGR